MLFKLIFRERKEEWEGRREGRGEKERKDIYRERCEKCQSAASCTLPDQGPSPQLRYVPCLGMEPAPFRLFGVWDDTPIDLATCPGS